MREPRKAVLDTFKAKFKCINLYVKVLRTAFIRVKSRNNCFKPLHRHVYSYFTYITKVGKWLIIKVRSRFLKIKI